jgi:hypothetical protein
MRAYPWHALPRVTREQARWTGALADLVDAQALSRARETLASLLDVAIAVVPGPVGAVSASELPASLAASVVAVASAVNVATSAWMAVNARSAALSRQPKPLAPTAYRPSANPVKAAHAVGVVAAATGAHAPRTAPATTLAPRQTHRRLPTAHPPAMSRKTANPANAARETATGATVVVVVSAASARHLQSRTPPHMPPTHRSLSRLNTWYALRTSHKHLQRHPPLTHRPTANPPCRNRKRCSLQPSQLLAQQLATQNQWHRQLLPPSQRPPWRLTKLPCPKCRSLTCRWITFTRSRKHRGCNG